MITLTLTLLRNNSARSSSSATVLKQINGTIPDSTTLVPKSTRSLRYLDFLNTHSGLLSLGETSPIAANSRKIGGIRLIRTPSDTSNQEVEPKDKGKMSSFAYPKVERNDSLVEKKFGVDVADPYRWLEDPFSEKTKEFVKSQNGVTEPYLSQCPHRKRIREILKANQDYERSGCPFKRGQKYYFFKNSGLQPQAVLHQQDSLDSEPKVIFDPNELSEDGTIALSQVSFSPNGKYFAYALSHSGSDWLEIKIRNVETGEDFPEKIVRAKFTHIDWTHDNNGIFYSQFPSHKGSAQGTETELNENHTVYYHILGTDQSEDVLKVNFPDNPKWNIGLEVSDDGRYLHIYPRDGCKDNLWYICDLTKFGVKDKFELKPIYEKYEASFEYLASNGDTMYFRTNLNADNYRICKLDVKNPAEENWVDIIPNHPEDVIDWAEVYTHNGQDYLLVNFMRKVVYYLELHKLDGGLVKKFDLPLGTITKTSGRRNDTEFFFQFTSFLSPGQTFHFDLSKLDAKPRLVRQTKPKNFNPDEFLTEQVFYKSKDGTEVPMFIIRRRDIVMDGSNPCLLYGYGGFNAQLTPGFNVNRIAWLKNFKGVYAVANIRGGGEFGQRWHDSGRLLKKQNVFDDFAAAAEYLISCNYTNRDKLAIEGGSNGGLLVAAVANQRPDIVGAVLCHVGVLDMIRFADFTVGHSWRTDYGDPNEEKHFHNLIKYSPYHNIPEHVERYPATLLLTADHDDRVVPAHSLKYIAQLQYKLGAKLPKTPLLIRIDTKAGHGAGRPVSKVIDEFADIYSFLYNSMGLEAYYSDN